MNILSRQEREERVLQSSALPHPKQGKMDRVEAKSAEQAAEILFNRALPLLQISNRAFIENEYEGFKRVWKARGLYTGTRDELYDRVLSNFRKTCRHPGFHFFDIDLYMQNKRAEAMIFTDGEGASVCLWRTEDTLYLCGNYYFE